MKGRYRELFKTHPPMQEVSKKDYSEVQRLLRYFISRSRNTDTSLKGVNARRRAGLVLKKWSKNDKKEKK